MRYLPLLLLLCAACSSVPPANGAPAVAAETAPVTAAPGEFEMRWRASFVPGLRTSTLRPSQIEPSHRLYHRGPNARLLEPVPRQTPDGELEWHNEPQFRVIRLSQPDRWGSAPMPFGRHPFGPWDVGIHPQP
jgi:hypothetical protein